MRSLNSNYERVVRVPIEIKNLPPNKRPVTSVPDHIDVELKTSGLKLMFIMMNQPFGKLSIDMNDVRMLGNNLVISRSGASLKNVLKFDPGIARITPDTIQFIENNGFQRNVPVKLVHFFKCAPGYGFAETKVSPTFLTVYGDSSLINNVDTLYTQNWTEEALTESKQKMLAVIKPQNGLYLAVSTVTAAVKVEKLVEKTIQLKLALTNVPPSAKQIHLFPPTVTLKYTALQNDLELSDTSKFKAAVDVSKVYKGKCPIQLLVRPGSINVLRMEPTETELLIVK